ncbi:MAG TPA: hypothetical protein VMB34_14315 [Acetobacteraceae bacterium]|nr:hypothetical protein [Acetobacteraceae bacterium]
MMRDHDPDAGPAPGVVEERLHAPIGNVPGERNALPPGRMKNLPPDPQGDENRDPAKPPMPPP